MKISQQTWSKQVENLHQHLADRGMANPVDPVFGHHTSTEGQPAAVAELPKISLISHPGKVVLRIILNRLKPQVEKVIAEEQAGFRAGRSTTEQIFNLGVLCEKSLQHQQDLWHVFKISRRPSTVFCMQLCGQP